MSKKTEYDSRVRELLFEYGAKGNDGFRQWLYPNLPNDYNINPAIQKVLDAPNPNKWSAEDMAQLMYELNS